VIRAVDGRAPVTVAAGELRDLHHADLRPLPDGVSLFKIGLAGCHGINDWPRRWKQTIHTLWPGADAPDRAVAVAYADWPGANAPPPEEVLAAAAKLGCPALLVDTFDKSTGPLFHHWPAEKLSAFVRWTQSQPMKIVLAGSLTGSSFDAAARLSPDIVAVRTAACEGGRTGRVSRDRVATLCKTLHKCVQAWA
jgi:uncharacterized protein (UPF0264 family)